MLPLMGTGRSYRVCLCVFYFVTAHESIIISKSKVLSLFFFILGVEKGNSNANREKGNDVKDRANNGLVSN